MHSVQVYQLRRSGSQYSLVQQKDHNSAIQIIILNINITETKKHLSKYNKVVMKQLKAHFLPLFII
jgi:hypothetical protein